MEYGRWWFEHWYLVQNKEIRDEVWLRNWRRDMVILTDYLKMKRLGHAETADFFNYVKERHSRP